MWQQINWKKVTSALKSGCVPSVRTNTSAFNKLFLQVEIFKIAVELHP